MVLYVSSKNITIHRFCIQRFWKVSNLLHGVLDVANYFEIWLVVCQQCCWVNYHSVCHKRFCIQTVSKLQHGVLKRCNNFEIWLMVWQCGWVACQILGELEDIEFNHRASKSSQYLMMICLIEYWSDFRLFGEALTFNVLRLSYLGLTRSISWLLMPWLLPSPRHQHPWYWLCRIGKFLSYFRKDFNYLCYVSVEEWHKM